jgi:iron complex transport system ATP-binding protein
VALAVLLAQDPEVMLLDEPTNHMDIAQEVRTLELLGQLARERGRAIVMALHDLSLAARYATHAVLLGDGEKCEAGPASALLTAEKLSALFGQALVAVPQARGTAFLPA